MFDTQATAITPVSPDPPPCQILIAAESVPGGFPSPAQDYFDGDLDLNEHLIRNKPATFVVRVTGDSMDGAGISNGDELIVDRSLEPVDGNVIIAVVDGSDYVVKRLRLTTHGPELHPENPQFPILRPTELIVWGVVTTCLHHLV